jgi:rhodanese-related sulfurtransferase
MQFAQERPTVPEVTVQDAKQRAEDNDALIVDVREPYELTEVSVPGALHIPLGDLPNRVQELPKDRELLFLCRSGNRSTYATDLAIRSGLEQSSNIEGGIVAWVEAELPHDVGEEK